MTDTNAAPSAAPAGERVPLLPCPWCGERPLQAVIDDAYRRGCEAMREAAAKACRDALWYHGPGTGEVPSVMQTLAACQKAIRALPIPPAKEPTT